TPGLDKTRRWHRELSEEDQEGIAFARALLHRPPWLVIDERLNSLDDELLARVLDVLTAELSRTGVIHIGRAATHDHVFSRVLHITMDPTTDDRVRTLLNRKR